MKPIERALWYVESHFNDGIDLGGVAAAAGVSRFYLARTSSSRSASPVPAAPRSTRRELPGPGRS